MKNKLIEYPIINLINIIHNQYYYVLFLGSKTRRYLQTKSILVKPVTPSQKYIAIAQQGASEFAVAMADIISIVGISVYGGLVSATYDFEPGVVACSGIVYVAYYVYKILPIVIMIRIFLAYLHDKLWFWKL